ncbi:unnamed protein product [Amoebophrya sp. A25]|nr:unnamed protein product [Amoebophrya sp. A25]|eukprot:GSA25T00014852001.1
MAPKKNEPPPPPAEDEGPPPPPEVYTKCFEIDGQLYYGDVIEKVPAEGEEPGEGVTSYVQHGKGMTIWSKKSRSGRQIVFKKHQGDYLENEMTGEGTIEYYDGSAYKGQLEKGNFEGEGIYTWPNKSFYTGQWLGNEMHGSGQFQVDWSGKFRAGAFHRNCVQNIRQDKDEKKWVDILEEVNQIEIEELSKTALRNDIALDEGSVVVTCSTPEELQKCIRTMIDEHNLVPLLVPDHSFGSGSFSPMDWIHMLAEAKTAAYADERKAAEEAAEAADGGEGEAAEEGGEEEGGAKAGASRQKVVPLWQTPITTLQSRTVHVGHISKMKRRGYDHSTPLFTALQTSLLAEETFCLVFDQYDDVKLPKDNDIPLPLEKPPASPNPGDPAEDEIVAPAPVSIMSRALELEKERQKIHKEKPAPKEWQLKEFYDECSLPIRLFNPKLFHSKQGKIHELILDYALSREKKVGKIGIPPRPEGEAAPPEGEEGDPGSVVGLDIHGDVVDENVFYRLDFVLVVDQPVVIRYEETREVDVHTQLAERFGEHFPLHRCGVVCCTMGK